LLAQTIARVQEQTFSDWEMIVVDDASTDDTGALLESLQDPRIRYIRRAERGYRSVACNEGLAVARGELVMFLDDDDLLRRTALEELVRALDTHPHALAAAGACRILQRNGDSVKVYRPAREHTRFIWRELLFGWWSVSGQNMYRTAAVRAVGGFDPTLIDCQDRKLWLEIAWRAPVCITPAVVMEYRQHDGQIKQPDLLAQRQAVWWGFIAKLPPDRQVQGGRIRRAAASVEASEKARLAGAFGMAFVRQLHAWWLAPSLVFSPLTGRPLWWGVKKCLLRVSTP
jgi:glycosyltransferase involved in cell wall biosynthesis